ncbi:hypothetical protein MMC16_003117 [Acarospora aff. strigata]|nr:hypothetical protein [Acarospora aff. strigata]
MRELLPLPTDIEAQGCRVSPLELVKVSEKNKQRLLRMSINASQEAMPETAKVLARLKQFHPSTAQAFGLKNDALSQAPLRFLCESSGHHQQDVMNNLETFIALSYCWHGVDWKLADGLSLPEMGWPISSRMVHGLLHQRVSSNEGVWIDQCCIDQDDLSERKFAIGSMDLIYKSARAVVVVLEDIIITEEEAALLQDLFTEDDHSSPRFFGEDLNALSHILVRILSARWFRRAWCCHELQLSADVKFLLPAGNSLFMLSRDSLEALYSKAADYCLQDEELGELMCHVYLSYDFVTRVLERDTTEGQGRSLMSEFSDIYLLESSVQTDKICIAINISGLQLYFMGHDKSADECRWILAMIALSAGDATVLGGIDDPLMPEDGSGRPSWLHWANDLEDTMINLGASELREPACIASIDQHHITLDLLLLNLDNCTIKEPCRRSCGYALTLLTSLADLYSKEAPEDQPYWMQFNSSSIERWRERQFVSEIIACSLDCGLDWMMQQLNFNQRLSQKIQQSLDTLKYDLWPSIRLLLIYRGLSKPAYLDKLDDERRNALLQYFHFVIFDSSLTEGDLSPSYSLVCCSGEHQVVRCGWLDRGTSGKALIPIGFKRKNPDQIAVPVALSDASCTTVRRLWFLQRCGEPDDKKWTVIEKLRILTLMPIEEDGRSIIRRNDQTIL